MWGRGQSREFAVDVAADRAARASRGGVAAAAVCVLVLFLAGYFSGQAMGWWD